jgi:nucleotide-binding universal stress UspA family protein
MISTILMATDGSEPALAAERYAASLAARLRARLHGVSVVEDRLAKGLGEDGLGLAPPSNDAFASYLKSRADLSLRRLGDRARAEGVEYHSDALQGIADDLVVERGQQADLIAIGRDGQHGRFRTGLVGSTADGVLRKTAKAALIVPPGAQLSGPLLLAFDGSPGALARASPCTSRRGSANRSTSSSIRRTRGAPSRASTRCAGSSGRCRFRCARSRPRSAAPTSRSSIRRARCAPE